MREEDFRSWPREDIMGQPGSRPWDYPAVEIIRDGWHAPQVIKRSELPRGADTEGLLWRRVRHNVG